MSEVPFDATEATEELTPMEAFHKAVSEAYVNDDDLDPLEAVSVLQAIAGEIIDCILASEDEEEEGEDETEG